MIVVEGVFAQTLQVEAEFVHGADRLTYNVCVYDALGVGVFVKCAA
jgi:hypothetical protein